MSLFPAYGGRGNVTAKGGGGGGNSSAARGGRTQAHFYWDQSGSKSNEGSGSATAPITIDDEEGGHHSSSDKRRRSDKRKRSRSGSKHNKRKKSKKSSTPPRDRRRHEEDEGYGHSSRPSSRSNDKDSSYSHSHRRNDRRDRPSSYHSRESDRHRGRDYDNNRGSRGSYNDRRSEGGRSDGSGYSQGRQNQEEQRLSVAQRFPNKVFLEEVNLRPEFAFRVDTKANYQNLNRFVLGQKSSYLNDNSIKVVGARDQDLTQIYSIFSKFRCVAPEPSESSGNTSIEEASSKEKEQKAENIAGRNLRPNSTAAPATSFIGFKSPKTKDSKIQLKQYEKNKEDSLNLKGKIEEFNRRVRDEPNNIALWVEFVEFQDKYYQQHDQIYNDPDEKTAKRKARRSRKALLEKKVSIIDKALESNPNNVELQLLRLGFMEQFMPPEDVLTEWMKLISGPVPVTEFLTEYFRFNVTQLQVYSTSNLAKVTQKSFPRFRQMLRPQFPQLQRPAKFLLIISDLMSSLTLILRNSGCAEKAVAIHQGQLEVDFNTPVDTVDADGLLKWTDSRKKFEFFWDIGTPRFGEDNAPGWKNYIKNTEDFPSSFTISIPEEKLSDCEDSLVHHVASNSTEGIDKAQFWLMMETTRSKLQWLAWRQKCSDATEIDDVNRIVLGQDISPLLIGIPPLPHISEFDRNAAYFRHLTNLLQNLAEDFVPQTETVGSCLNPFMALSVTESRTLGSELFYWKKLLNFYLADETAALKMPPGFSVEDWTTPYTFGLKEWNEPSSLDFKWPEDVRQKEVDIMKDNGLYIWKMLRSVVQQGITELSQPFGSVLFEMYMRYEQKSCLWFKESRKIVVKRLKSIMQNTYLGNSLSAYYELATLEYFQGNVKGAVEILVKTINQGVSLLAPNEAGDFDVSSNWETMAELTKLYFRLAELQLRDKPSVAYHILTLLSGFKPVNLDSIEGTAELTSASATNVRLKSLRNFEKVMSSLVQDDETKLTTEMLGMWDGDKCIDYSLQKTNIIVEWTRAFALFQYFTNHSDFSLASQVYEKMLSRIDVLGALSRNGNYNADNVIRHHIREQLYINWCNLSAYVLSRDPMLNSKFRNVLGTALKEFPSSPPLLLLFTDVENQMSIAGKLWRMMVEIVKKDGHCNHWTSLVMGFGLAKKIHDLEHDEAIGLPSFGLGGPAVPPDTIFYKLDAILSAGQSNCRSRHCPLLWRVHLKLLAQRSLQHKNDQKAKSTFYEAIGHCPSVKPIYMDGVAYFPDLLREITELMREKQLSVRTPLEELTVLLAVEDELAGISMDRGNEDESVLILSSEEDEK